MMTSRILKWAAAGALALGAIPAIGLAHTHVSLPTSSVTVTPTSLEAPAFSKAKSHVTHASKAPVRKASVRKHHHVKHHVKKSSTRTKPAVGHAKIVKKTSLHTHKATTR
jgi:hypothetical protein